MPDTYRVIITDRAFDELDKILAYIASHSPQNAARMIDQLLRDIEQLDVFPRGHPVVGTDPDTGSEVRSKSVRPYAVRYRIDESAKAVYVLTIRHGARRPGR